MSLNNLRLTGMGALAAAALAVTVLSGPAQASPQDEDRASHKVKTPVAQGCNVSKKLIKNGQRGVSGVKDEPAKAKGAKLVANVDYVRAGQSMGIELGQDKSWSPVAAVSATSWYDKKGNLEVRVLILPLKDKTISQRFQVSVHQDNNKAGDSGRALTRDKKVGLTGRAICIRSKSKAARAMLTVTGANGGPKYDIGIPLPDKDATAVKSDEPPVIGSFAAATRTNELSVLAANALNGKYLDLQ